MLDCRDYRLEMGIVFVTERFFLWSFREIKSKRNGSFTSKDERMKGRMNEWMVNEWNNECINGLIYIEIRQKNDQPEDQKTN